MAPAISFLLWTPAVLLYTVTITVTPVVAHGQNAADAHIDGTMNEVVAIKNATEYGVTYFTYDKHSGTIYAHITAMVLAWVFILPIGKQILSHLHHYLKWFLFLYAC